MIGEVIGSYRIVEELGKGGMGMVYRAEHVQLGRPAALKMLLPQFSHESSIVQRFFNEAKAASAIDHPGIVEVYDFGTHGDGRAYIVMALLRGETLQAKIARGPLGALEIAGLAAQIAAALSAAHARGIVHRDLKPDNIFLVPNELVPGGLQVKLLDFGIAKLADEQQAGLRTQTGALIGTPAYMSPEQCMGKSDLDHRTDLYSLGCIMFHALTGRPPFTSEHGTGMIIAAHLRDAPPDVRDLASVPGPIAEIVRTLLAKEPAARFQTAAAVRQALVGAGAAAPVTHQGPAIGYSQTVALGSAPTTASSAAAQMATANQRPPRRSALATWLVAGGLAAIGIAGILLALTQHGESPPAVAAANGSGSGSALAVGSGSAAPATAGSGSSTAPPLEAACPEGQSRRDDTSGHCCWPGQAWSSSKTKCVGTPSCPKDTVAKGDTCVGAPVIATGPPPAPSPPPTFTIDHQTYTAGETIEVHFAAPMTSSANSRAWLTTVDAGSAPSAYGNWQYVDDRARTATITAPDRPGSYEVRLHTDYPTKSTNLRYAQKFTVPDTTVPTAAIAHPAATPLAQQKLSLGSPVAHVGAKIDIHFAAALVATGSERFWVAITLQGKPDTDYGAWDYVPAGAHAMTLTAPAQPGDYEVRLHANYPTKTTNVVSRAPLHVD